MFRKQIVLLILILITILGGPTSAYANGRGIAELIAYSFCISLIIAIVFSYFANKFVSRKTEGKRKITKVGWMIASVLAFFGVLVGSTALITWLGMLYIWVVG